MTYRSLAALFNIDNLWSAAYELFTFVAVTALLQPIWTRKMNWQMDQRAPEAAAPFLAQLPHRK